MLSLFILASTALADPISDYAARRLQCWSTTAYESTTTFDDDGTISTRGADRILWGVKDGRGLALDTETFATMVGDDEYLAELNTNAERAAKKNFPLTVGGGAAAGLGGAGMLLGRTGSGSVGVVIAGTLLLSGGGAVAGLAMTSTRMARAPLKSVTAAYDRGLANQRCGVYNDKLRGELGLTRDQTHEIDTASLYTASPRTQVAWAPVIGPGVIGVAGTF